jgi:hypothetical protein
MGDQWAGAAFVDETSMYNRVDTPINAMAHELATWGHDFAVFRGHMAANTAVGAGANIPFTVETDTALGWNATTKVYVVGAAGLYAITAQLKTASAGAQTMAITGLPTGQYPRAPKTSQIQAITGMAKDIGVIVRLAGGETIAVTQQAATTDQGDTSIGGIPVYNMGHTWLRISQIGH